MRPPCHLQPQPSPCAMVLCPLFNWGCNSIVSRSHSPQDSHTASVIFYILTEQEKGPVTGIWWYCNLFWDQLNFTEVVFWLWDWQNWPEKQQGNLFFHLYIYSTRLNGLRAGNYMFRCNIGHGCSSWINLINSLTSHKLPIQLRMFLHKEWNDSLAFAPIQQFRIHKRKYIIFLGWSFQRSVSSKVY